MKKTLFFVQKKYLKAAGVDLIVTNQSEQHWTAALNKTGYLAGPSNYIFFASKQIDEILNPLDVTKVKTHFNRGDGDGPINL
jgi:hypothetical protein